MFFLLLFTCFNLCSNAEMYQPGKSNNSFEGYVWDDINENGIYDEEEKMLEGIKVNIVCDNKVISTMETDRNGYYKFSELPAGNYRIEFEYGTKEQMQKELNLEINTYNKSSSFYKFYNGQDYRTTLAKNITKNELPIRLVLIIDTSSSMAPINVEYLKNSPGFACRCTIPRSQKGLRIR